MWRVERDVDEERLGTLRGPLHVNDRGVSPVLGAVDGPSVDLEPVTVPARVVGRPGIPGGRPAVGGAVGFGRRKHPAEEDWFPRLKGLLESRLAVVPLTDR